jgi:hypothetical protein
MISASCRSSSSICSDAVPERVKIAWNFGRLMTSANSVSSAGLLTRVSVPARTCTNTMCGGPRHSKPDSSTLVSMTARTLPTLNSCGLHLRLSIDLFHWYRFDSRCGHAIGDRQEPVGSLPASNCIKEQSFECRRCQKSCLACGLGRIIWQFDLNFCHGPASSGYLRCRSDLGKSCFASPISSGRNPHRYLYARSAGRKRDHRPSHHHFQHRLRPGTGAADPRERRPRACQRSSVPLIFFRPAEDLRGATWQESFP